MTTPLAVGQVLEVTVGCTCNDQFGLNVSHWQVAAVTAPPPNDGDTAAAFDATFAPLYKPAMTAAAFYFGVRAQIILPAPRKVAVVAALLTGAGTDLSGPLPEQVSGLISLRTNTAGRGGRGRLYPPFPAIDAVDDPNAKPTGAYTALLQAIANVHQTPFLVTAGAANATLVPVLLKRSTGATTPVTGAFATGLWATQRRRGNYGKTNVGNPF